MTAPVNPDCRDGKHRACGGDAWDFDTDHPAACACACHGGPEALADPPAAARHGVLYSHAHQNRVDERPTRKDALVTALAAVGAQPGIEFELMRDDGNGWRSDQDETPDQVVARRWAW